MAIGGDRTRAKRNNFCFTSSCFVWVKALMPAKLTTQQSFGQKISQVFMNQFFKKISALDLSISAVILSTSAQWGLPYHA
jgi:hypothetical protein